MAASIVAVRGQKRPSSVEPPSHDSSKKQRVLSDTSNALDVVPSKTKISLSKRSDKLAPKALSMLCLDVQMAIATFHMYWTDRWKTFVESSDSTNVW